MITAQRKFLLIFFICLGLFSGIALAAEDLPRTPSEQMKDAVDKLNKTPTAVGKSLQGMTDGAKDKLQKTFGSKSKSDAKVEPVDLELPKKAAETPAAPKAMKATSRDPFRPMTMRTRTTTRPRENLSPLERLDLSQLKIVGIVWDTREPRAMIEDTAGLGYVVKVGTPIGSNDGKVKAIRRNQIIVEEYFEDVYGARKPRDVSMRLMTE
jgi:Tfp pilus assembly protein PilP